MAESEYQSRQAKLDHEKSLERHYDELNQFLTHPTSKNPFNLDVFTPTAFAVSPKATTERMAAYYAGFGNLAIYEGTLPEGMQAETSNYAYVGHQESGPLAIASFRPVIIPSHGLLALDIVQLQGKRFDQQREQNAIKQLIALRWNNFFVHMVEQLALHVHHSLPDIPFAGVFLLANEVNSSDSSAEYVNKGKGYKDKANQTAIEMGYKSGQTLLKTTIRGDFMMLSLKRHFKNIKRVESDARVQAYLSQD